MAASLQAAKGLGPLVTSLPDMAAEVNDPSSGHETLAPAPTKKGHKGLITWIIVTASVVFLLTPVLLMDFVGKLFVIENVSMSPALRPGDRVVVEKLSYDFGSIQRGDIIIFTRPPNDNCGRSGPNYNLDERVIGLPGETISLRSSSNGYVFINGKRLIEGWLPRSARHKTYSGPASKSYSLNKAYVIPANHYFVMGDRREVSCDSRFWAGD
jgi:signal peptidase I